MKQHSFVVGPSENCPFSVEGLQYIPDYSCPDGLTLLFLHAMNLHKETFHPVLSDLLDNQLRASDLRIRDVWCLDNPSCGNSSALNQSSLLSPQYFENWTATDYALSSHAFLSSSSHGVDFKSRRLIGVAHSAGAASLMLLLRIQPTFTFRGLILLDPALLVPGKAASIQLARLFNKLALSKKDTWDSRSAAYRELSRNPAYRRWDPEALRLFTEHGLRTCDDSDAVTLACSKVQESAYFRMISDIIDAPFDIFFDLTKNDEIPVHLILCLVDEFKGLTTEMKQIQMDLVQRTRNGSIQKIEKGGHMFPQTEPALCSEAVRVALRKLSKSEVKRAKSYL